MSEKRFFFEGWSFDLWRFLGKESHSEPEIRSDTYLLLGSNDLGLKLRGEQHLLELKERERVTDGKVEIW